MGPVVVDDRISYVTHIGGVNLKLDDGMRFDCNPLFLIDFRALDHQ